MKYEESTEAKCLEESIVKVKSRQDGKGFGLNEVGQGIKENEFNNLHFIPIDHRLMRLHFIIFLR